MYSIPIGEKKVKELVFELDTASITLPSSHFFIVMSRVVPNKSYDAHHETYSASPALNVQAYGQEGDVYWWSYQHGNQWIKDIHLIPLFQITIEVEPVDE